MSEDTEMNGAGFWKVIAIGLMTLITGTVGTWATLGSDRPNRTEVREMIKNEAPSNVELQQMRDEIVALKIEQARTSEKIDLLLKKEGVK